MSQGMDPEVKRYFRKIIYSLSYGLLWMTLNVMAGIYWGFGLIEGHFKFYNLLFFCWLLASLGLLLYYYYRTWRNT